MFSVSLMMDEQRHTIESRKMPVSRWSLVNLASADEKNSLRALGELMAQYWEPLYFFARKKGWSPEDAKDSVQGFYAEIVRRGSIKRADNERGRLRTFFLSSFENFLAQKRRDGSAQKRGSGDAILSLDVALAEGHFAGEPVDSLTPERLFDRRWIHSLLERVLAKLRFEYESAGKGDLFALVQSALARDGAQFGYADAGAKLGISENAMKKTVARLRAKYRDELRREIADTLTDNADVDDELRSLMLAFA